MNDVREKGKEMKKTSVENLVRWRWLNRTEGTAQCAPELCPENHAGKGAHGTKGNGFTLDGSAPGPGG